ncbi:DNA primase [Candidatus Persebacteraceae bacterium Df01]|uniref:DNA primase n=1 Tax=Candidatus Doriopsillibacter californiensis TaxID=2970740 RepID=A0ABT7QM83_9GAMM|nr:DNA primase [Candidatus Persebacteraceae bacterium Df01]
MNALLSAGYPQPFLIPIAPFSISRAKWFNVRMAISREFIQRLIAAADLEQVIGETVKLKKQGKNLVGLCPFHAEKTPSFSVNTEKGFYYCFGCGANGDALRFIVEQHGGDFVAGVEILASRLGMPIPRGDNDKSSGFSDDILREACAHWQAQLKKSSIAREYLTQRGLEAETLARFNIGYAADAWNGLELALSKHDKKTLVTVGLLRKKESGGTYDYFRNRIMFPIMENNGRVSGFGGRALGDDTPKYLNSPDSPVFSKGQTVFGLPQARQHVREKKRIIITEGYMDTVMLSQAGFSESVATMGTAVTARQMEKIIRSADNVIFAFDGDDAGRRAAWRGMENTLPVLRDGASVFFLFLPQGEDPDSFVRAHGAAAFEKQLSGAESLADYIVRQLWENSNATSEEGRSSAALQEGRRLLGLVGAQRAPFLRELLQERLAARAKLSVAAVHQATQRETKRPTERARFKMRREQPLYKLLCCLAVNPALIEMLTKHPPLPGEAAEVEVIAAVLHHLRWHPENEESDLPAYLESEGYLMLSRQVQETGRIYAKLQSLDVEKELSALLERLAKEHHRRTGAGKRQWLADIRKHIND